MKDPVFAGKDVAEAVRVASRTLALPEALLRYVVLDPGQPGGRGLSPTEARIAVLIERVVADREAPAEAPPGSEAEVEWERGRGHGRRRRGERPAGEPEAGPSSDPAASVRAVVAEMARAGQIELSVELSEGRDGVDVRLEGSGTRVFFDPQGEALAALEHLIERLYGRALAGRRLRLRCSGYREYRDELLRKQALELAQQVRSDGQPRTTAALNSYERRVIHLTLEGEQGVVTFSVGEGHGRRVTVAAQCAGEAAPPAESGVTSDLEPSTGVSPDPGSVPAEAPPPESKPREEPAPFDARRFDRPAQGGGASELM